MSAFSTNPSEYLDICICMLMDAIKHGEDMNTNSRWDKFIRDGKLLGLKTVVYFIYLTTDVDARIKYKMLAPTLRGERSCIITIRVEEGEVEPLPSSKKVNKDLIKKIFKKVKEVRFKTSMPITEARLDKIIDYVVKKHEEDGGVL